MGNVKYLSGPFVASIDDGATAYRASAVAVESWNGFPIPLFTASEVRELARVATGEVRADDAVIVVGTDEHGGDVLALAPWVDGNGERELFTLSPVASLWGATPWEDDRPLYSFGGGLMWSVAIADPERDGERIYDEAMRAGCRVAIDAITDATAGAVL